MKDDTRVIVIEDSPIMRHFLTEAIGSAPGFRVVAAAHNAADAWLKIETENPDLLTLDVEMPEMDGITFLDKLMRLRPIPVVMVSALTQSGSATTLRALRAGAVDFIGKPEGNSAGVTSAWLESLISRLRRAVRCGPTCTASSIGAMPTGHNHADAARARNARKCAAELIAIECGSGDVEALRRLLAQLPRDCPPVVIAQQLPDIVVQSFVDHAGRDCAVRLKVGQDGDPLLRGVVLVCGDETRISVESWRSEFRLKLRHDASAPGNRHSIGNLFESCAKVVGRATVGILMDSAADDGMVGLLALRSAGARGIVQVAGRMHGVRDFDARGNVPVNAELSAAAGEADSLTADRIPIALFGEGSEA
jgi:two-component system, chemotaxis family, protein-glutamate methylesterase/glutaminase